MRFGTILFRTLATVLLILMLAGTERWAGAVAIATSPTLARLSFWVPQARMAEFEAVYKKKLVRILKTHGLVESSERSRATPDSIFSRLFELKTPSEVEKKQKVLHGDVVWKEMLRSLGTTFGTGQPDNLIRYSFRLYAAPAGPGKVVPAGPGTGHWRSFDVTDGLASVWMASIFQDREGCLWFGTGSGVSRFDGQGWTTFTTKDGLAHNVAHSIMQDQDGHFWFGTGGGVSRYNGKTHSTGSGQAWTTFTTKDGLAHNLVWSVFQDRDGHFWFGTGGGVSRYDPSAEAQAGGKTHSTGSEPALSGTKGQAWTTFTTQDGLAHNVVYSIMQDREGYLWFGTWGGGVSRYDGKTFITFATKDGLAHNLVYSIMQDRDGHFWFGTGGGVSRYDGKTWTAFTIKDGLAHNVVLSIIQDREGHFWFGTGGGVSLYDGKTWTTFTTKDGLAGNEVYSIIQDREGHLWFATEGNGVSWFNGKVFTSFTSQDGLAFNWVRAILQDRDGHLWFGTFSYGVSRYDGKNWTTFTTKDGLAGRWVDSHIYAGNRVESIFQDREGHLWFGTLGGGVSRYDGKTFTIFTTQDGLAHDEVSSIIQDREGNLYFGTRGGVSRYDGKTFTTYTTKDGLAHNEVYSIIQDRKGYIWFGTWGGGVSRYDGKTFTTFTTKDGLADNRVGSILQDQKGIFWFGTWGGGVSRYDGKTFTTYTTRDGLAHNEVYSITQDREGYIWFGTDGRGVSRYDGQVFQTVTRQDGLASNSVTSIFQDREGHIWFGTSRNGVTRKHAPAPFPPPVFVDAVVADRRYEETAKLEIPSTVRLTAFEFHGNSIKTRPEAMVYRYRLKGYDRDWKNTHARRVEYQNLPVGTYTFEVQAVDRDLVYSEKPATVRLTIHPPYGTIALAGGLGLALVALTVVSGYAIKRRRDLFREMEKELQTAHDMQMALMPRESPRIEGLDIAGRCIPANHVGGDFFQYFHLPQDRLTLVLADVTGHAMEAAIPVVMFSGILKSHMETGGTLQERFRRLNRSLHGTLTGHTLVCLMMGDLDLPARAFSLSDSGCSYPYHYRISTGDVVELQVDAYPLGVRPDTEYPVMEVQLENEDRLAFCSDGVMEATNGSGEQFGYERTAEVIRRACEEGLSAEATVGRVLGAVSDFRGHAPQADDMTCVVVRVAGPDRDER